MRLALGVVLVGALVATGCGMEAEEPCPSGRIRCLRSCIDPPQPTFSYIHENIIAGDAEICATNRCHGPLDTKEQLELTEYDMAYDNLVGRESVQRDGATLVVPGQPENSYLMNKLTGEDMEARDSLNEPTFQMPRAGGLCEEQVEAFEEWIRQGAQRN